jgi:hypothetical protein
MSFGSFSMRPQQDAFKMVINSRSMRGTTDLVKTYKAKTVQGWRATCAVMVSPVSAMTFADFIKSVWLTQREPPVR